MFNITCPHCNKKLDYTKEIKEVDYISELTDINEDRNLTYCLTLDATCPTCKKSFKVEEIYTLTSVEIKE